MNTTYRVVCLVVLFIMLHKVVLTFEFMVESLNVTIQMEATEQYVHVVLFAILYRVLLLGVTFVSVDEILKYDHSSESY